ncbi:Peptide deformylase [subsurface metagenome]|uniref:Peptide deformylase n=1 Tax=marine sediment metagenome TaxID=412755 RepID=X1U467_9ZZZZ
MRELIKLPDELLRQKSQPVKKIDRGIKELALEMVDFMRLHRGDAARPVGLSAVQLGKLVRVIAFSRNPESPEGMQVQVLINPEVVYLKSHQVVSESCLSIPGRTFALRRAKLVEKPAEGSEPGKVRNPVILSEPG